jgi:hypothetical protein
MLSADNMIISANTIMIVPVADQKIQLVDEIMMPKSEYDTVHEFIAYVEVEKTSAALVQSGFKASSSPVICTRCANTAKGSSRGMDVMQMRIRK